MGNKEIAKELIEKLRENFSFSDSALRCLRMITEKLIDEGEIKKMSSNKGCYETASIFVNRKSGGGRGMTNWEFVVLLSQRFGNVAKFYLGLDEIVILSFSKDRDDIDALIHSCAEYASEHDLVDTFVFKIYEDNLNRDNIF